MRILFLYIKRCVPFADCEFSFDSNYRFKLERLPEPRLTITHSRVIPKGFFSTGYGPEEFYASVSAVIGRNGSGKTSLALVLKKLFRGEGLGGDFVAVFQLGSRLVVRYKFENETTNDKLSRLQIVEIGRKMPCQRKGPGVRTIDSEKDVFKKCSPMLFYLSPAFTTEKCVGSDESCVFDYSTTALLRELDGESNVDVIRRYEVDEKLRVYRLVRALQQRVRRRKLKGTFTSVELLKGSGLHVRLNFDALEKMLDGLPENAGFTVDLRSLKTWLSRSSRTGDLALKIFLFVVVAYANDIFRSVLFKGMMLDPSSLGVSESLFGQIQKTVRGIIGASGFADKLKKLDEFAELTGKGLFADEKRRLLAMQRLVKSFREMLSWPGVRPETNGIWVSLSDKHGHFMTCLDAVRDMSLVGCDHDLASVDIVPRLASGEMAFLSIWGRLYQFVTTIGEKGTGRKECIVYLDEVETCLHPEWQRKLVWNVLRFFEIFAPWMRPHVIFSSHSPLILSDVPIGNVVFLERSSAKSALDEPLVKVAKICSDRFKNTFAANVYDLYRLSFFMQEGLVGQFASRHVDQVLRRFRKGVREDPVRSLVGDTFIRGYLEVDG